jgi:hypothetical protein
MSKDDFERILNKLDKIDARQDEHSVMLARMDVTLNEYVKQTNEVHETIKPIKKHVTVVEGIAKVSSVLVGLLVGLKSLGLILIH